MQGKGEEKATGSSINSQFTLTALRPLFVRLKRLSGFRHTDRNSSGNVCTCDTQSYLLERQAVAHKHDLNLKKTHSSETGTFQLHTKKVSFSF